MAETTKKEDKSSWAIGGGVLGGWEPGCFLFNAFPWLLWLACLLVWDRV